MSRSVRSSVLVTAGVLACMALAAVSASDAAAASKSPASAESRKSIVMPLVDSARGRRLFVTKGCVICHSVAGVGGRGGPALDAQGQSSTIDVLDFVSRMWRGAPVMIMLQEMELGYRVELAPAEIADLAGFVSDAGAQRGFSLAEIPEVLREWMVNERYWENEDEEWRDKLPEAYPDLDEMKVR